MRFRYFQARSRVAVAALGGRFVRPRPVIPTTLIGPTGTIARDCLLDSAADEVILPEHLATRIGVDLDNAALGTTVSVRYGNIVVRRVEIKLRLTDGIETCEWGGLAAFTPARLIYPILGFAGCLQFFDATFRGALEEVELIPNSLYPGV